MTVALEAFGKKVTELVLNSTAPWVKPWGANCAKGLPVNALTGRCLIIGRTVRKHFKKEN